MKNRRCCYRGVVAPVLQQQLLLLLLLLIDSGGDDVRMRMAGQHISKCSSSHDDRVCMSGHGVLLLMSPNSIQTAV